MEQLELKEDKLPPLLRAARGGVTALFVVATVLSPLFALWGTYAISREDFSINDVSMYVAQKHYTEAGDDAEVQTEKLFGIYSVRLRPPYADIVRNGQASFPKGGAWEKHTNRYKIAPTTTITYDMSATASHNYSFCSALCLGDRSVQYPSYIPVGDGGSGYFPPQGADTMHIDEAACLALVPGCVKSVMAETTEIPATIKEVMYTWPIIDKTCTDLVEEIAKTDKATADTTAESTGNAWKWAIVGLWSSLVFCNTLIMFTRNARDDEPYLHYAICFVAGAISITLVVIMAVYAAKSDALVRAKTPDSSTTSFRQPNCYGSYYADPNVFGYVDRYTEIPNATVGNTTSNTWRKDANAPFEWNSDYRLKTKTGTTPKRVPKPNYNQPFTRGPRAHYMITGAVAACVHVLAYIFIGCYYEKGTEYQVYTGMSALF